MATRKNALCQAFGLALRTLRRRAGYSQEGFALEAGINRGHLNRLECGRTMPKLDIMYRICALLNVPLTTLAREVERSLHAINEKD